MTITIHGLFTINTYTYQQLPSSIAMTSSFDERDYSTAKSNVLSSLLHGTYQKMYVEAWKGVGATALLREVAEEVESKKHEYKFDMVIKVVRPALFQNTREIQRAVVKQLNLPPSVSDKLDAADEDDDFSNVKLSSRDRLFGVEVETYGAVKGHRVLLVLCDNIVNDKLIYHNLGIHTENWRDGNAILWTIGMNTSRKAPPASVGLSIRIRPSHKEASNFERAGTLDLVCKEAIEIARYIDESSSGSLRTNPQIVLRCFWYCLLLCTAFNQSELLDDRPLEAVVKYFVCEGILQGDAAWEIGRALAPLIGPIIKYHLQYWQEAFSTWTSRDSQLFLTYYWKENFSNSTPSVPDLLPLKTLFIDSITQKDWIKSSSSEEEEESYRWISVRSPQNNNPESWDFSKVYGSSDMSKVSSIFGHFEKTYYLPDIFFDHFSNIRVLDLLGCVVSPINSSFLRLRSLRMLRLERCKVITEQCSVDPSSPSSAQEEKREQQAIFFDSLWVLNLYNSDAYTFLLAGKAFELMPNLSELDLTAHINTEFLPRSLSMAINLKELILTDCKGLQYLNFNLPATIETIKLQKCASLKEVELGDPTAAPLPNLKTFHLSDSKLIAKLSLQGCRRLENVDLQKLTGLKVLNLSCTAIKVVDITKLPQLKQLLLLGCVLLHRVDCHYKIPKLDVLYLDNYNNINACDVDHCLDSFQNQRLPDFTEGTNDANQRSFRAHVVVRDVRLFRSLRGAIPDLSRAKALSRIHVKSSSTTKRGINTGTTTKSNATITTALCYADVLNTMTDRHCRHHPPPPTMPLNNQIEVDGGDDSRIQEEAGFGEIMKSASNLLQEEAGFGEIMKFANSLFVHDNTFRLFIRVEIKDLKYLHIEKCHNMDFIFSRGHLPYYLVKLESIWLSQLPRLEALRREGGIETVKLKHIYLEFCARLEYVLPPGSRLRNLETINIRYCNDLTTIFDGEDEDEDEEDDKIKDKIGAASKRLPNLKSIHLQELPKLQHIYKQNICAPSLEELKIRGCFNLRKLPLFGTSDARSIRAVKISCEKDWWDNLQWDGLEKDWWDKLQWNASLFNPKHCPYYKKPMKARWL